jgi:hypothetical protein
MALVTDESLLPLPETRTRTRAAVDQEGLIAGLLGAAAIALWFFVIDVSQGRPLHTPTVLGTFVFRRGEGLLSPDTLALSFEMAFLFTWVHALIFIGIGFAASRLLLIAEYYPNLAFGIVLFFVVFEAGFLVVTMTVAQEIVRALSWPAVLVGNLLAAAAMGTYFWRRHPDLRIEP